MVAFKSTFAALAVAAGLGTAALGAASPAFAVGEAPTPPDVDWSFEGVFGTYDRGQLQRGFQVYKEVCASCHSMDLVAYRHLEAIGFSEEEVEAIAADYQVTDGPDDSGEMYQRPAEPSDYFVNPFENEAAARMANGGAYPPDMSVLAQARPNGADYIHGMLIGYDDPPPDVELMPGMYWNEYFPGHQIAMPPILQEGIVQYADGTPNTLDQMARDVTAFLMWAAEPHLETRKQTGVKVMLFLIVFAGMMYAVKRKVWSDQH